MYSSQIWPIYARTATINCYLNKTHRLFTRFSCKCDIENNKEMDYLFFIKYEIPKPAPVAVWLLTINIFKSIRLFIF